MTVQRLRPAYPPAELNRIYAEAAEQPLHIDHRLRVAITVNIARSITDEFESVADLSCGNAHIIDNIPAKCRIRGDLVPLWEMCGPIDHTLPNLPPVELYVCTETIEHLDDPAATLRLIRARTTWLVLSTPVDAWGDPNPEHYWAWSRQDVEAMLTGAGFKVALYNALDFRPGGSWYRFGIWVAK